MAEYEDPDYDIYDQLLDTDTLALRDRCREAEAKVARLEHIMACADTPLMRDVMAERDLWRTLAGGNHDGIPMPIYPPDDLIAAVAEALDISRHYDESFTDQARVAYVRAIRWVRENTITPETEARLLGGDR